MKNDIICKGPTYPTNVMWYPPRKRTVYAYERDLLIPERLQGRVRREGYFQIFGPLHTTRHAMLQLQVNWAVGGRGKRVTVVGSG